MTLKNVRSCIILKFNDNKLNFIHRPTLPWFSPNPGQISTEKTTTPRNPLPSYPFPILPQFDPSTAKPAVLEDTTMTTTTTTTTQITTATTTSNYPVLNIAGLDGVAIPASAEALEFYIVTMTEKIGSVKNLKEKGNYLN